MVGYRPSSFGGVHVAVNFDVPETGAANEQVVDARFGDALLLELGAWIALFKSVKFIINLLPPERIAPAVPPPPLPLSHISLVDS